MDKISIERVIQTTLSRDQTQLRAYIQQTFANSDPAEWEMMFNSVLGYIAMIPNLIVQINESQVGQQLMIASSPLMQAIKNYYAQGEDLLPKSQAPDARSLLDDTYYTLTMLQLVQVTFANQYLLNGLDLNYGRWLFGNLLGGRLATQIEKRANSDLRRLTQSQQTTLQNNMASMQLSDVNTTMHNVSPASVSSATAYNNNTNWYDYQSSGYLAEDQFEADSAGWPGGAYDNPDSSYYSYSNDY